MKKTTVSIYIPAYNEAENIENLITKLFQQKINNYQLTDITVVTDGSIDMTASIVKNLQKKNKKLRLIENEDNRGKYYRLNQIFKQNTSDIVVILDGDLSPIGNTFLINLIHGITKNPQVVLATAHSVFELPNTLTGKLVSSCFLTWDYIRLRIPHYDSVHNFSGQATAYRGSFAKKLNIPKQALEERTYLYLMAKKENSHGFAYIKTAKVQFLPISTIKDFILLTKRPFGKKQEAVDKIFGYNTEKILIVPVKYKLLGILDSFVHHPLLTPVGLVLNFILPKIVLLKKTNTIATWAPSTSTKRGITL